MQKSFIADVNNTSFHKYSFLEYLFYKFTFKREPLDGQLPIPVVWHASFAPLTKHIPTIPSFSSNLTKI